MHFPRPAKRIWPALQQCSTSMPSLNPKILLHTLTLSESESFVQCLHLELLSFSGTRSCEPDDSHSAVGVIQWDYRGVGADSGYRGGGFGLSWGGIRVFVGKDSGFRGGRFGLSWGRIRAFVRADSRFVWGGIRAVAGAVSDFRGGGFRVFVGKDSGFREGRFGLSLVRLWAVVGKDWAFVGKAAGFGEIPAFVDSGVWWEDSGFRVFAERIW